MVYNIKATYTQTHEYRFGNCAVVVRLVTCSLMEKTRIFLSNARYPEIRAFYQKFTREKISSPQNFSSI